MTPFARLSRGILERLAGRFYEGPDPPDRLGEMVVEFANANPHATRGEWVAFASAHAGECYRSGHVRGYEAAERDYRPPEADPEVTATELDPDWRWQPGLQLRGDPGRAVLEANDEQALADEAAAAYYAAIAERNERRRP